MKESKIEKPEIKEEEMEKSKEISAAEKGELPPIFMIYRDNDLFKEWVPKIAETLKSLGRQVKTHAFPVGTEQEEIRKWITENKDMTRGQEILADNTVSYNISQCRRLDELLDIATLKTILGERVSEKEIREFLDVGGEYNIETAKKGFLAVTKKILENKKNIPKEIHIFAYSIVEHPPFLNRKAREAELRGERRDEDYMKPAEKVKEWLVEAGYPEESIKLEPLKEEKEADKVEEKLDKEDNWIIADRHYYTILHYNRALRLRLPLLNFYSDAKEAGLIAVEHGKLEREVKEMLREDFGAKPKEK